MSIGNALYAATWIIILICGVIGIINLIKRHYFRENLKKHGVETEGTIVRLYRGKISVGYTGNGQYYEKECNNLAFSRDGEKIRVLYDSFIPANFIPKVYLEKKMLVAGFFRCLFKVFLVFMGLFIVSQTVHIIKYSKDIGGDAYVQGMKALNNDDYDTAIAELTKEIESNPKFVKAYYQRGRAYSSNGDADKALADFTEVIRLDPKFQDGYYARGFLYDHLKDYDNAIADYTEAIRLKPNDTLMYLLRAGAYKDKGDYDNAIADYEAVLKIDPDRDSAKKGLEEVRKLAGR